MAEDTNFEVNRRSAEQTQSFFTNIKAQTRLLSEAKHTAFIFFEENQHVVAVALSNNNYQISNSNYTDQITINGVHVLFNDRFLVNREIDSSLIREWFSQHSDLLVQGARGEIILLNVTPFFTIHILAMVLPHAVVLFSPDSLTDSFSFGTNQSYLVNGNNEVLIHSDFDMIRSVTNISEREFIKTMRQSDQQNLQTLYTNEDRRFFGAFTKLDIGGSTVITSIEYDKVFEGIVETTKRNIYLTISVLSISVLLIWFFAKSISIPLKRLAKAAQKIEGGEFEVEVKTKRKDEIGLLANSFQKMSGALGIFGRFTNKEIALLAMRGQIKPGGLPKHATIFFSDIRGFTEKSEIFTKEYGDEASDKIVFWLNDYLSRMVDCVEKTGGTIDKFIGDAVMAHWGTATTSGSPEQDALNCVKSALMMRIAVLNMNRSRAPGDKGNPEINIGCGINTGIVTAGQIGSELRMEYTVIGDPVNLASRVESLCKPLAADILISEDTWLLVKDEIITEEMPAVSVKGKEKPVRLFAVINTKDAESGPFTLADVRNLMGIKPPQENVDINAEEKKYKIPTSNNQASAPEQKTEEKVQLKGWLIKRMAAEKEAALLEAARAAEEKKAAL